MIRLCVSLAGAGWGRGHVTGAEGAAEHLVSLPGHAAAVHSPHNQTARSALLRSSTEFLNCLSTFYSFLVYQVKLNYVKYYGFNFFPIYGLILFEIKCIIRVSISFFLIFSFSFLELLLLLLFYYNSCFGN